MLHVIDTKLEQEIEQIVNDWAENSSDYKLLITKIYHFTQRKMMEAATAQKEQIKQTGELARAYSNAGEGCKQTGELVTKEREDVNKHD